MQGLPRVRCAYPPYAGLHTHSRLRLHEAFIPLHCHAGPGHVPAGGCCALCGAGLGYVFSDGISARMASLFSTSGTIRSPQPARSPRSATLA